MVSLNINLHPPVRGNSVPRSGSLLGVTQGGYEIVCCCLKRSVGSVLSYSHVAVTAVSRTGR